MMADKKALESTDGDFEAAKQLGLARRASPPPPSATDRESARAEWSLVVDGNVGAIVKVSCETDFVASS